MIALMIPFLVCGFEFVEQDICTVRVNMTHPLTGQPLTNFRHADIDLDGTPDLVFADGVHFQTKGFPADAFHPYPDLSGAGWVDTAGRCVYMLQPDQLIRFQRDGAEWTREAVSLGADLLSPDDLRALPVERLRLGRFLYDIDGDQIPEVVIPGLQRMGFLRISGEGVPFTVQFAGEARVFPEMHLSRMTRQDLWPEREREISLPQRSMSCRVLIEDHHLRVIERREETDGIRYLLRAFTLEADETGQIVAHLASENTSGLLPMYMTPCNLNSSGSIGYAGGTWSPSEGMSDPVPIYETGVSVDGSRVFRVRRRVYRPQCSLADYDGDGAQDLIVESATIHQLGLRETLMRALTQNDIEHTVSVYRQGAGATFSEPPAFSHTFTLSLDTPLMQGGEFWQRYKAAELLLFNGDCSGDGILDAVVHESPGRAALYLGTGKGYTSKPVAVLPIDPSWRLALADVDGDGRSDVVAHWNDWETAHGEEMSRVWLSRGGTE